tara:strand:+ start:2767 stop:4530 length:1764 start_codon:yes stop_codon:yes gene_type:complete
MIASFLYDSVNADIRIDFIYRNDQDTFKEPLYHKSVKQLNQIKNLKGLIIPGQRKENEPINYHPLILIEHIRLLKDINISSLPIFIVNAPDDLINKLEVHLDYGIDIFPNEDVDFGNAKKLSNSKLNSILNLIANNHDGKSRHNQSNEWGSYRLASSISSFNSETKGLSIIQDSLSESIYYKKLLLKESLEEEYEMNNSQKGDISHKLSFINDNAKKVAIIDDMIDMGWREAYLNIFYNAEVECYNQQTSIFNSENSKNFDLIILDLRLIEDVKGSPNDVLEVENLSGIKLLKEIKKYDPSVPVIISTASNKSWSLKSALNNGADGYWSKEDPNRGLSLEYRFENTYNFLDTIHDILNWSQKTRCVYKALIEIYNKISFKNPLVAKSLLKKTNVIYGQLHGSQSDFVRNYFGQSGLEVSFITISSFINEIIGIHRVIQKNENDEELHYLASNEERFLFCHKNEDSQFILYDDVIDDLTYEIEYLDGLETVSKRITPNHTYMFFPEKQFMHYLLVQLGMEDDRKNYITYSRIRNKIDMIHGKPIVEDIDPDLHKVKIDDIYQLLEIFYRIFLQKPCEYFPKKKKYFRK